MHELSICRSMVDIVDRFAAGRPVDVVRLQVGQLRQIVPETLVYCWTLVNEGTAYAATALDVEQVPAAIECRACGHRTVLSQPVLVCSSCAGTDVRIVAGEQFLITSMDVREADPAASAAVLGAGKEGETRGPLPPA
jgi:hydrogenase nickel incorporation protein HypA/HybF